MRHLVVHIRPQLVALRKCGSVHHAHMLCAQVWKEGGEERFAWHLRRDMHDKDSEDPFTD